MRQLKLNYELKSGSKAFNFFFVFTKAFEIDIPKNNSHNSSNLRKQFREIFNLIFR